jgi:hypothetical protein
MNADCDDLYPYPFHLEHPEPRAGPADRETHHAVSLASLTHRNLAPKACDMGSVSMPASMVAKLGWIDWFNHRRLLGRIGNIPPADAEKIYCARRDVIA